MSGTQPARGMRDFLPEDVRRRQYVIGVVADVYQRYGFEPLETPAVENIETLLGKYGEEGDKLIFKILKRGEGAQTGEADLALRYDLTVPLARVVAEYRAKLPKFFKRYQVQPVWRADRPQKGRFREFYQCDVDAIGSTSMMVEAELLGAACEVLQTLGFNDFKIRLNHRRLLQSAVSFFAKPEQFAGVIGTIDKIDKIGLEEASRQFVSQHGISQEGADFYTMFFGESGSGARAAAAVPFTTDERLAQFETNAWGKTEDGAVGVRELKRLVALTKGTRTEPHIRIDPSLARGLSYYTGPIFEIQVADLAGSLGGGGRYDNLIGMFLGQDVPACGISLGLERILVVMGERGMFPDSLATTPADVLVTLWNAERASDTLQIAATLRAAGLRVEVYPDADKVGKQFKYAASRNIPFVVVAGDDEIAAGTVAVKNLTNGEQAIVPRGDAAATIKAQRSA